jgi:transketolase
MRLLRGQVPVVLDPEAYQFEIGHAKLLREGSDVALVSTGLMTGRALQAADTLADEGIQAAVIHVSTIKPFDAKAVLELVSRIPRVVVCENHVIMGGLASAVADAVTDAGVSIKLRRIGIPDCFCESGSLPYLARRYRMESRDIAGSARALVNAL